ncbi:MAG: hydantoinase/oxoprolinase family protein [Actinomycetia bacterium]|nr:hydantoinase/oxoprolinase family protein [Actinomycetes bacterium]
MGYYLGVDGGGTFTDCAAMDDKGRLYFAKATTTKDDFAAGMFDALSALADECGTSVPDLIAETERFNLGTTVGTNLLVERRGARTGLLTTAGHGDAILIMRGTGRTAGLELDLLFHPQATQKPLPLVPRALIREIDERTDCAGNEVVPLDEAAVEAAVRSLVEDARVTALAIAFLWSFKNPAHELRALEIVRRVAPAVYVCCSHQVAPRLGEYERTVATVINSYVAPASAACFQQSADRLRRSGLKHPLLIMQTSGGVLPADKAIEIPLTSLGSGPVGGLMGSLSLARALGHKNIIATDMGGTSFEVGLIINGEPLVGEEKIIDRYRYRLSQLETTSIACGGGSIARIDPYSRSIRVGPESAGAEPGPVCYRRGGTEPTVTDADVVLGLLSADGFLGGRMPLDREAALRAVAGLGEQVGLGPTETAAGILRINNLRAAELIRQQTVVRGYDPRDFVVYAYGGAGPLHAFAFAQELGVKGVVIPLGNGASTLSAYGCSTSDLVLNVERERLFFAPFPADEVNSLMVELENQALDSMRDMGKSGHEVEIERFGLMRYGGQWLHSLLVHVPPGELTAEDLTAVVDDFRAMYDALYGHGAGVVSQGVEMVTARIRVVARLQRPTQAAQEPFNEAAGTKGRLGTREIFWPDRMERLESDVFDGREIGPGERIAGPAVVELPYTSVAVGVDQMLECDLFGNFLLRLDQPAGRAAGCAAAQRPAAGALLWAAT